ncbi:hypothetical protein DNTS_016518 [Danionella cerebrum]|uniref:Uncharacterized protein n=1 Tax=Danionella cerebrum TaxID=2873325 RepID=A0A553MR62_9TELE|nr:hypothetical protein DNTS_016518 [Danionella translucida]
MVWTCATLSAKSFFESHMEETKSSEVSCHISSSTSNNGDLSPAGLHKLMLGLGGVFDLDVNMPGSNLIRQSGMQINMQAKKNSSASCSVREGHKMNMAISMDHFGWSRLRRLKCSGYHVRDRLHIILLGGRHKQSLIHSVGGRNHRQARFRSRRQWIGASRPILVPPLVMNVMSMGQMGFLVLWRLLRVNLSSNLSVNQIRSQISQVPTAGPRRGPSTLDLSSKAQICSMSRTEKLPVMVIGFCYFTKLALFHTFTHIPVNKSSLGIHQIKLVIQTSPGFSDGCCVAQHAHSTLHLRQVSSRHHSRRLVVNAHLETSGTPVHKLDASLGLDCGDGGVDIFGNHISTVEKTAGHVLTMARVALHHLIGRLKAGIDHWGVGGQREVDSRVGHQVGLKLCQIYIQGSIKTQRCYVIDGFVVDHEGTVRVLKGGVGVNRKSLHEERSEPRASASTETVEDQETLEPSALIRLKVDKDCSWDMFSSSSLTEESVEGVISSSNSFVTWHLTIWLDTMLQAIQLPACIAHLGSGLADTDVKGSEDEG